MTVCVLASGGLALMLLVPFCFFEKLETQSLVAPISCLLTQEGELNPV